MDLPKSWERFLDERLRYVAVRDFARKQLYKRLPPHTGWMHVFGSLALLTFVSQFVTGILLLLYYRPTLKEAHESIQYITGEVAFGWLFRQVKKAPPDKCVPVGVFRCSACGFLESYARPEFAAK